MQKHTQTNQQHNNCNVNKQTALQTTTNTAMHNNTQKTKNKHTAMQQKHCRHVSSSHFSSSHFGSSHFGSSHFVLSHWTKSCGVLLQNKLLDQKWWSVAPEQPFVRPGVRLGAPKKHKIVTKTIWYTIYGEILFQKVASGYLLHFVQDGSSQNVLEKIVVAHKSKKWKKNINYQSPPRSP